MGQGTRNIGGMGEDPGGAGGGAAGRGVLLSELEEFQARAEQEREDLLRAKLAAETRKSEAERRVDANRGVLEEMGRRWVQAYLELERSGAIEPPRAAEAPTSTRIDLGR